MMTTSKPLIILLAGTILGAGLVLACGDDQPPPADAAEVCNCPAAEPPIPGRIVMEKETSTAIEPRMTTFHSNGCPSGSFLLSGGCRLEGGITLGQDVTLSQSYLDQLSPNPDDRFWVCEWASHTDDTDIKGFVQVTCLKPKAP